MLAAWMNQLYQRPAFISADFEGPCQTLNAACG